MRRFGEQIKIALHLMAGQYVHWALRTLHVVVRNRIFEQQCFFFITNFNLVLPYKVKHRFVRRIGLEINVGRGKAPAKFNGVKHPTSVRSIHRHRRKKTRTRQNGSSCEQQSRSSLERGLMKVRARTSHGQTKGARAKRPLNDKL